MVVPTQNKHITWGTVPNADNYEVFVDGDSQGLFPAGGSLDLAVPESTTRQITVRGNNGSGYGPLSTAVPATVGNLAPPPVAGLTVISIDRGLMSVDWSYPDKPVDHSVYVVTSTAGTVTIDQANASAVISGLGDSVTITVTVKAQDTGGLQSTAVSKAGTTEPAPPPAAPATPGGFIATRIGYSSADFSWNASTGATGYQLSGNGGASWTGTQTARTYKWVGLAESTAYTLKLRAVGAGGNSGAASKAITTLPKVKSVTPVYSTRNYGYGQTYPWNQTGVDYYLSGVGISNNNWASGQWLTAIDANTNTGPYNTAAGAWLDLKFTLNFDSVTQVWGLWGYPGTYEWSAWNVDGTLVQQGRVVIDATVGVWLIPNVKNSPVTNKRITRLRTYFYGGGLGSGVYKLRELAIQARVITSYTNVLNPA